MPADQPTVTEHAMQAARSAVVARHTSGLISPLFVEAVAQTAVEAAAPDIAAQALRDAAEGLRPAVEQAESNGDAAALGVRYAIQKLTEWAEYGLAAGPGSVPATHTTANEPGPNGCRECPPGCIDCSYNPILRAMCCCYGMGRHGQADEPATRATDRPDHGQVYPGGNPIPVHDPCGRSCCKPTTRTERPDLSAAAHLVLDGLHDLVSTQPVDNPAGGSACCGGSTCAGLCGTTGIAWLELDAGREEPRLVLTGDLEALRALAGKFPPHAAIGEEGRA